MVWFGLNMSNDDAAQQKPPELIGSADVCARLGIERSTLIRRVQLGHVKIAAKMPGKSGAYLFDPEYIDRLVEAQNAEQRREQWANLPPYTDPADPRAPGHKNAS